MPPLFAIGLLGVDVVLLLAGAHQVLRATGFRTRDLPSTILAHALAAGGIFAAATLLLGHTGLLFPPVLTLALALGAAVPALFRPRRAVSRAALAGRWKKQWRALDSGTRLVIGSGGVLFAILAVLAANSASLVPDDLTYRLPRIGVWTHSGSLGTMAADDPRLNYMPVLADLLQWWVTARFETGFPGVALVGCAGGGLAALAVFAAGRILLISRFASAAGAVLLLLSPPAFAQIFTAQTDLTTAGLLAAGGYFLLRAGRTGRFSWLGGLGVGLAFAAKSTPVYLAPAGLAIVGWLAWKHPRARRHLALQAAAAALFCALFAGPKHLQNWRNFGNPAGPRDLVALHSAGNKEGAFAPRFAKNFAAWSAQNLDPNSNPPAFRRTLAAAGERVVQTGISDEAGEGVAFVPSRRAGLLAVFRAPGPEADTPAFGMLPVLLCAVGVVWGVRRARGGPVGVRPAWIVIITLLIGWFAVMAAMAWHPYGYRYACLVLPLVVLLGVAPLSAPRRFGRPVLMVLCAIQGIWAGGALATGYQYGPWAGRDAGSLAGYLRVQGALVQGLPAGAHRVVLASNYQAITAGFFRTGGERHVDFARSESLRGAASLDEFARQTGADAIIAALADFPREAGTNGWRIQRLNVSGSALLNFACAVRSSPERGP